MRYNTAVPIWNGMLNRRASTWPRRARFDQIVERVVVAQMGSLDFCERRFGRRVAIRGHDDEDIGRNKVQINEMGHSMCVSICKTISQLFLVKHSRILRHSLLGHSGLAIHFVSRCMGFGFSASSGFRHHNLNDLLPRLCSMKSLSIRPRN